MHRITRQKLQAMRWDHNRDSYHIHDDKNARLHLHNLTILAHGMLYCDHFAKLVYCLFKFVQYAHLPRSFALLFTQLLSHKAAPLPRDSRRGVSFWSPVFCGDITM